MQQLFQSYNKNLSACLGPIRHRRMAVTLMTVCLFSVSAWPAAGADLAVWHLKQLHRSLGSVEIYLAPGLMRLEKGNGDIIVLYRGDTNLVYIFNPPHKAEFRCPLETFYKRGFMITASGLSVIRSWKPRQTKDINFKGVPAKVVEILAAGHLRTGQKVDVKCAEMKVLSAKENFSKAVSVIETLFATPTTGKIPIEMTLNYSSSGGELWFQTRTQELRSRLPENNYRLETSYIAREKKNCDFFAAPKNYKVMKSDEHVLNLTDTASDLTRMILPEP